MKKQLENGTEIEKTPSNNRVLFWKAYDRRDYDRDDDDIDDAKWAESQSQKLI